MTFLIHGPEKAAVTLLLAHGAGAPMDSPAMEAAAQALAGEGLRVLRFEFAYMASRRTGSRRPPPKADLLMDEFWAAIGAAGTTNLIIGGKSMGGRVASMVADECYAGGQIKGLLCLGYPFHPPAKPEQLRTAHLADLQTPCLIAQGTRDPFGTKEDVATYGLSAAIEMVWLEDGDHDLKPRRSISVFSADDHLKTMAARVQAWAARLV